jgi:hypothetical protein
MFDELVEKLARGGLSESEISTTLFVFKHDALAKHRHMLLVSPPPMARTGAPGET